ncbi:MAG: FKBP-type peptidyl-prolyl cis-trans isomerase, partial [Candidatus Aenigmarchaeota archaeon]|nr:FKBP-type peptidyl-prolyl cis-trans isomerase [Candidatus Aenigmarchaeota archaeon]
MQDGDFVRIAYVGRLESGEIFDLTDEELAKKEHIFNPQVTYRPIPVIIGAGFVIPGMDRELKTMQVGEKKHITVQPEEAFGKRDPSLVKILQKKMFQEQNALCG